MEDVREDIDSRLADNKTLERIAELEERIKKIERFQKSA